APVRRRIRRPTAPPRKARLDSAAPPERTAPWIETPAGSARPRPDDPSCALPVRRAPPKAARVQDAGSVPRAAGQFPTPQSRTPGDISSAPPADRDRDRCAPAPPQATPLLARL